jgi:hypothetical protein
MDTVKLEFIDWLYINFRRLNLFFAIVLDYLLGQELSPLPLTMANIDTKNNLWVGNKTSCYPDIIYVSLEVLFKYFNEIFKDNEAFIIWLKDAINKIPSRFELLEEQTEIA